VTVSNENTQASTSLSHDTNSYHCKCNYIRAITHATQLEVHINSDTQKQLEVHINSDTRTIVQISYHPQYNNSCQSTTEKRKYAFTCAHSLSMSIPNVFVVCRKKETHYQNPPKLMSIRSCFIRSSM